MSYAWNESVNSIKISVKFREILCIHYFNIFSKSESVKFSLIELVISLFTNSSVQKYFLLLNQLIFIDSSMEKICLTVKLINFHWSNQWNLTDSQ